MKRDIIQKSTDKRRAKVKEMGKALAEKAGDAMSLINLFLIGFCAILTVIFDCLLNENDEPRE